MTIIAIGKLVKVVTLVTLGTVALVMVHKDPPSMLVGWADALRVDTSNRAIHRLIAASTGLTTKRLEELGAGTFAYAAVFAVEGTGLWLQKRWAEYFTIGVTISFVPLEVFEIVHRASAPKIVTLVLNIAAVVYLVARAVKRRRERHGTRSTDSSKPASFQRLQHPMGR